MSLIEATVSLSLFAFGLVGVLHLQLVAASSSNMARKVAQASSLAQDLTENVALWSYDDPRLVPGDTVATTDDPRVARRSGDTRAALIADSSEKFHYAELTTANALAPSALRGSARTYDGLGPDVDGDGSADFERYWNVFGLDSDGDGAEEGKLIVVVVRWHEGGLGYRRVVQSTFRSNAGAFSL